MTAFFSVLALCALVFQSTCVTFAVSHSRKSLGGYYSTSVLVILTDVLKFGTCLVVLLFQWLFTRRVSLRKAIALPRGVSTRAIVPAVLVRFPQLVVVARLTIGAVHLADAITAFRGK